MRFQDLPYDFENVAPDQRRARSSLAALLRWASRTLDALAERLALMPAPVSTERVLEYHADAGAPEGALYVNGQLVGHVTGVTRL